MQLERRSSSAVRVATTSHRWRLTVRHHSRCSASGAIDDLLDAARLGEIPRQRVGERMTQPVGQEVARVGQMPRQKRNGVAAALETTESLLVREPVETVEQQVGVQLENRVQWPDLGFHATSWEHAPQPSAGAVSSVCGTSELEADDAGLGTFSHQREATFPEHADGGRELG